MEKSKYNRIIDQLLQKIAASRVIQHNNRPFLADQDGKSQLVPFAFICSFLSNLSYHVPA